MCGSFSLSITMPRTLIVDVQGFKVNGNKFVYKEVGVIDCTTMWAPRVTSSIFKPPFPLYLQSDEDRKQTEWLQRNLGLDWKEGNIPYHYLSLVMKAHLFSADIVFVKGCEKKEWLRRYVPSTCQLVDLHEVGCPALHNLPEPDESLHKNKALQNVWKLFDWLAHKACQDLHDECKNAMIAATSAAV